MKARVAAIGFVLALCCNAGESWPWGATGHEWIGGIAIEKLPDTMPAFIRTPEAAAEIAVLGRELDRSKGADKAHDAERDPGHYVDLADDATALSWVSCRSPSYLSRARSTTPCSGRRAPPK